MGTTWPGGARRDQGPEIDIHRTIPESLRDVLPGRGTDFFPVEVIGNDGDKGTSAARYDLRRTAVGLFRHGGGWRTELLFAGAGLFGVSVYFLLENTALLYTYASNTSVILCTAPFFTGLVCSAFLKERMGQTLKISSLLF